MAKTPRPTDAEQTPSQQPLNAASDNGGEQMGGPRSPERIAARAYELYEARGESDGQDFDDWLAAERELSSPSHDERPE
jgi:hypothetical protein